ncbi:MAG TPA: spondin domain-containing protein [Planctomycetota bacterium]|jgi:hypothetical protein|nr:spondin domain-containing protein [Planctomycetota bacterium]
MRAPLPIFASALLLAGCDSMNKMTAGPAGGVEYEVTLTPMWTASTHPLDYPKAGLLTGPHFSGLIGATHDASFAIFREGSPPTPGLERLSEEGKHSPLDAEIRAAIASGHAGALLEGDPIRDLTKSSTVRFRADEKHPLVSVVAMIAPSPDWFAGAGAVNLREGGSWASSKEVTLYAYDSGGDDGMTYEAADADANPKEPTRVNDAAHFLQSGKRVPVGKVVFRKI